MKVVRVDLMVSGDDPSRSSGMELPESRREKEGQILSSLVYQHCESYAERLYPKLQPSDRFPHRL